MGDTAGFMTAAFLKEFGPANERRDQKKRVDDATLGQGQNPKYDPNATSGQLQVRSKLGGIQDQRQRAQAQATPVQSKPASAVGGGAPAGISGKTALGS